MRRRGLGRTSSADRICRVWKYTSSVLHRGHGSLIMARAFFFTFSRFPAPCACMASDRRLDASIHAGGLMGSHTTTLSRSSTPASRKSGSTKPQRRQPMPCSFVTTSTLEQFGQNERALPSSAWAIASEAVKRLARVVAPSVGALSDLRVCSGTNSDRMDIPRPHRGGEVCFSRVLSSRRVTLQSGKTPLSDSCS